MRVLAVFILMFVIAYVFSDDIFAWLMTAVPENVEARSGAMMESFLMKMQISMYCGTFLSLPFIVHQIYGFIRPALKNIEDATVRMYLGGGFFLLIGALAFTHTILPHLIESLQSFVPTTRKIIVQADIKDYISNILTFYLGFSILFQVPLVVFLTIVQGFVDYKIYTGNRKVVIIVLLTLCAIFSPPDIQSCIILFLPLQALFEISVLLGRLVKKRVRS